MPREREYISGKLTFKDYSIRGNDFRAYYDSDDKLVFVLDSTVDDIKSNVLLVMNPVGNRKWDDVLANDYNVDLETVRPKKDNKYQKLDIEYSGLKAYDDLISDYENGDGIKASLAALQAFRAMAVKNNIKERLINAEQDAEKARDTIAKTNETIDDLTEKQKELRTKLSQQKKKIGKEPTKQSAAKILRTEAQIDFVADKIKRAKKRIANAQKRLLVADEEIENARRILSDGTFDEFEDYRDTETVKPTVVASNKKPEKKTFAPVFSVLDSDTEDEADNTDESFDEEQSETFASYDFNEQENEPKVSFSPVFSEENDEESDLKEDAKEDTDEAEEVKPLFDKDPNILDENIAFKPISFNEAPVEEENTNSFDTVDFSENTTADEGVSTYDDTEDLRPSPLSFVPPVEKEEAEEVADNNIQKPLDVRPVLDSELTGEEFSPAESTNPVLDSLTAVDMPSQVDDGDAIVKDLGSVSEQKTENMSETAPASPVVNEEKKEEVMPYVSQPAPAPRPMGPAGAAARPVSPITGVAPVSAEPKKKPTLVYYVMLIVLIALSIFTLWVYQKKTSDTTSVPNIAAVNQKQTEPVVPIEAPVEEAVVAEEVVIPEPVEEPKPEPVMVEVEPEPVEVVPQVEEEPVIKEDVQPEPVVVAPSIEKTGSVNIESSPFITPEPVEEPKPEPVAVVVDKPAYNVSQQEKMFVADETFDTDRLGTQTDAATVNAPVYDTQEPVVSYESTETLTEIQADNLACSGGAAPDMNGCCPGELYSDMGDGSFACCSEETGECFPPLM